MSNLSIENVNQGFKLLQDAQTEAKKIESELLYCRHAIGATADATGLVQAGVEFNFFAGTVGSVGNGFTRSLGASDQSTWVNAHQTPGGVAFMGTAPYIHFHWQMPAVTQLQIAAYGKLLQDRLGTIYLMPRGFELPSGRGIQATALATGEAATTIQSWGNGPMSPIYQLPEAAAIYIPPTQSVKFVYKVDRQFFATNTGGSVASGGVICPRDGSITELGGVIEFGVYGVRFAVVG